MAEYLAGHPDVAFVNKPDLPGNRYYPLTQKYLPKGAGGIFTFGLRGGREAGAKFIDALQLFGLVANVGDVRSQVIHPATTTHSQLSEEQMPQGVQIQTAGDMKKMSDSMSVLTTAILLSLLLSLIHI